MDGAGGPRVTAAMVAERAGTSVSTVSLVVNGKSRGRVSPAITERVRTAVHELGYVVDHAASSLARGRTDLVVLLAPDLPNPYFGRVTTGIREALGDRHQLMLSVIASGTQPGADDVRRVAAFRPAGLLVHAPSPTFLDELDPGGPPLVLLDAPGFEDRAATVTFDLRPGVRALVGHLAAAGHRTIAYLDGATPSATFAVRRAWLREIAATHGITVLGAGDDPDRPPAATGHARDGSAGSDRARDGSTRSARTPDHSTRPDRAPDDSARSARTPDGSTRSDRTPDGSAGPVRAGLSLDAAADTAVGAIPGWLDAGATAVVAAADTLAYGVLAAAHRLGLDVPGDLAVAGFDDLPYSQVTAPPLTSVALPAEELGRAAAHRLTALLTGTDTPGPAPLASRLAVRASTAPP
ncbi:LacI family DNA-binding transcriptional regulator [Pseudonocardia parietis]|uniref:LacI family transcriptional regulator n=1 Tax=Pseudonocardia parietis TaxID=570936 RepID=A0ABS4VZI6_9PSEU|nr:LacI family DNA-binding transcriptional regulator [Pseudonocardia parietis]MBP2369340.1 LacI family transcriptional regulator [Pseudonocardia parietis]